ncbi:tetratricopeptide repeat protein [Gaoshiqia sediminis]|uniref:Tetratricopeptide repeat protein n=1 Tax=Gaoshiqia sediminis TaxID=2986998 RepID=A0AA42C7G4_9BACT|nr:tetratricopeptide repeat protein [Gaoshiqia sediminis]MCW0483544.1 tetratricopeptide repeat protein [Gaoshiqia sediminis]
MTRKLILLLFLLPSFAGFSQKIDLLLLNREFEKAIIVIDEKLAENPSAELYYKRSLANKQLMDYPAALKDLNHAISFDSTQVIYRTARADMYQSLGNYEKAVADFKHALIIHPGDLLIKYELGKAYLWLNDYSEAYETFEEIQSVDSTNVMFNKYSALAAFKAEKYKRAIYLYHNYLLQNEDDLSAYLNLAASYEKSEEKTRVKTVLFSAKQKFPNSRALHLKLANTFFENKDYQFAQQQYHKYMARYDTLLPVLLNYGICLYHNKQTEDAVEILEKCYSAAPNDVYVNFYLGVCHKRLNEYDLASEYLDFAIYMSIPEFHPEMYHHLAQVYGAMREFERSIECYKKAYELDANKVEVLFEIATTYEEFNFNSTLALNYYRAYLKEAGEQAENADYALSRIEKIKEELFFE